jgi:hypothetical protein
MIKKALMVSYLTKMQATGPQFISLNYVPAGTKYPGQIALNPIKGLLSLIPLDTLNLFNQRVIPAPCTKNEPSKLMQRHYLDKKNLNFNTGLFNF